MVQWNFDSLWKNYGTIGKKNYGAIPKTMELRFTKENKMVDYQNL